MALRGKAAYREGSKTVPPVAGAGGSLPAGAGAAPVVSGVFLAAPALCWNCTPRRRFIDGPTRTPAKSASRFLQSTSAFARFYWHDG
jgi:hypothetical protein